MAQDASQRVSNNVQTNAETLPVMRRLVGAMDQPLHFPDEIFVESEPAPTSTVSAFVRLIRKIAVRNRPVTPTQLIWSVYHANGLATVFYEKLGAQRITDLFFMKLPVDTL